MTAKKAASSSASRSNGPKTVTVKAPFQVNLDGKTYGPGEQVKAPADVAEAWRLHGYIE